MQPCQLHIGFTKQFKEHTNDYRFVHTQRFGNIIVEQYEHSANRFPVDLLNGCLGHSAVVREILATLESNELPDTFNVLRFSQKTAELFSLYAQAEPNSANYFKSIVELLFQFIGILRTYRERLAKELVKKLELFLVKRSPSASYSVYSDDIEKVKGIMVSYLDSAWKYYREFQFILQHESEENRGVRVTSRVQQCLEKLTALMEMSLPNTECLISQFDDWKKELVKRELQEIYN